MANVQKLLVAALVETLSRGRQAPIPAGGELLWSWFIDLNRTRTYHAAGPNPISHGEIASFASLSGWRLEPRHVAIITAMDEAWLSHLSKSERAAPEGVKTSPPISARTISAGLVDAMFGR